MTYGDLRQFVMQLINQYSSCGVELTEDYNDQADYFVRIPGLYNAAMLELAAEAEPLKAVMHPAAEDVTEQQGFVLIRVPEDFLRMPGDGIPIRRGGRMTREKRYYLVGADTVAMERDLYAGGILEYFRSPVRLTAAPEDTERLDGTVEMQTAAAYYIAAMLVMQDDAFAYAALRNEYDEKLTNMKRRMYAEPFFIEDQMNINYDFY